MKVFDRMGQFSTIQCNAPEAYKRAFHAEILCDRLRSYGTLTGTDVDPMHLYTGGCGIVDNQGENSAIPT